MFCNLHRQAFGTRLPLIWLSIHLASSQVVFETQSSLTLLGAAYLIVTGCGQNPYFLLPTYRQWRELCSLCHLDAQVVVEQFSERRRLQEIPDKVKSLLLI